MLTLAKNYDNLLYSSVLSNLKKESYMIRSNPKPQNILLSYTPQIQTPNICIDTTTNTIKDLDLGSCRNGYIGKIFVEQKDGTTTFLNLHKRVENQNTEVYKVLDDYGNLIGETKLLIRKNDEQASWTQGNVNHVFVDELMNYSKPNTPFYKKNLKHYKGIGTKLLQIALKRSFETGCEGNIELIAKDEAKPFYLDVIKMCEKYPEGSFERRYNNPNKLYLPKDKIHRLENLNGGI